VVTQVQRKTDDVRHRSSKDLWVHSRNLEGILLPSRIECIDGILQVTVPGVVPAHQCLSSSVNHYLSTSHMRGGTSVIADHHLPVKNLHGASEFQVPWPRDTLDPVLRGGGTGDAQLEPSVTPHHMSGTP
jgi:hypothetical protein